MTLEQIHQIGKERKRLAKAFLSLLASRNSVIDSFDKEYARHVRLTAKKDNPKQALKDSLDRSRNMKKFQIEMNSIKNLIRTNQMQSYNSKKVHKKAKIDYQQELISKRIEKRNYLIA